MANEFEAAMKEYAEIHCIGVQPDEIPIAIHFFQHGMMALNNRQRIDHFSNMINEGWAGADSFKVDKG